MKLYSKYGTVFKKLRKQREFSLTSFTDLGISSAMLCKFENGKTMIKLDRLVLALSRMSVTLSEYEKFLNNYELDIHEQLVKETIIILMCKKYDKLPDICNEALELNEKIYSIAVKAQYSSISKIEFEKVCDYFEEIKFWRYIDLYSLYLLIDQLKPRQISYILEGFFNQEDFSPVSNSFEHNIRLAHIVSKSVLYLSCKGHEKLAKHFLNYIQPENFFHTMYTKNLFMFVKGCWNAKFINSEEGKEEMEQALNIFKTISSPEIANYYADLYKKYQSA
ncbi:Rgg/GadR/MutR family transcriptional regulator [Lactococcus lactis]|uniref:Rgg/GadR/MutR family transcriptional regulator n=1 Tax=Lactococcus lactis TaxID=1358 RepID=UPI001F57032E|nr:Rgg/GadR/MutR family transcriptional regulator [Lactococcus lactis]